MGLSPDHLNERASAAAAVLQSRGVAPGDRVGILGPNRAEWVEWAYGAWLAGAAVVPVQLPLRVPDAAAFAEKVSALVAAAGCSVVVTDPLFAHVLPPAMQIIWNAHEGRAGTDDLPTVSTESTAVIQFTSGSTAEPKGALISHRAVMAQLRALGTHVLPEDVYVGWAPFFHDLGLMTYVVWSVLSGVPTHVLATEDFARDPASWLALIEQTRGTMSFAPQSAWAAAFRAARRRAASPDLSTLELAWFAAEPIDPRYLDGLPRLRQEFGLKERAVGSTYGLAEAVLGVTSTGHGDGLRVEAFDLDELGKGQAVQLRDGPKRLVSSGRPLDGMRVRIAQEGQPVGEHRVGEIEVGSDSLLSGYATDHPNPVVEGWLRTGDEGFLSEGELFVTGRLKDLVISMGVKFHPEDFEWAAGRLEQVRPGRAVAFSDQARERIILVCEPATGADARATDIRRSVADAVGRAPDEVLLVPAGTIEKTTSGKLRRSSLRDRYANGELPGQAV